MTRTVRFPTKEAQQALAARFGLPHNSLMQDWEYEVADVDRFDEFLSAYTPSLDDDQRLSLMEILIQCVCDSASKEDLEFRWSKLEPLLKAHLPIHVDTIEYWACLDAEEEDEMFPVATPMRSLLRKSNEFPNDSDA